MAINDTYLLTVRGTANSTQHIHTLHFREGASVTGAAGLLTAWQGTPMTAYRAMFHTGTTIIESIKAQEICGTPPLPAASEFVPAPAGQLGTRANTNEPMPAFLATQVKLTTGLAGRSRQGRFFIGGMWENDNSSNSLATAWVALVQAYCDALKAIFVTPGAPDFRLVVHSRKLAAQVGMQCQNSSTSVTNLIINLQPTTMRSRKLGHGL